LKYNFYNPNTSNNNPNTSNNNSNTSNIVKKIEIIIVIEFCKSHLVMSDFQYYSTINPTQGELVLVEFTEKLDSFFDAKLIEYPYRGMMNYSDASKKRKISSWNKLVPLHKQMIARVDEVDEKAKIVHLSIAYLDEYFSEKNLAPSDIQDKLLLSFGENKLLEGLITSVSTITKSNYPDIWTSLIHIVDSERREFNDDSEDEPMSLWKYFSENFDEKIEGWCAASGTNQEVKETLIGLFEKRKEKGPKKITSTIKIISQEGITSTKKLLDQCLGSLSYHFTFKYTTAPNFVFETSTADSSPDDHHELIKNLQDQIKKLGLGLVFVQAIPEEVAKVAE
jgi:translation initiation factor 2 alpha subunit (eIF-2alpha)